MAAPPFTVRTRGNPPKPFTKETISNIFLSGNLGYDTRYNNVKDIDELFSEFNKIDSNVVNEFINQLKAQNMTIEIFKQSFNDTTDNSGYNTLKQKFESNKRKIPRWAPYPLDVNVPDLCINGICDPKFVINRPFVINRSNIINNLSNIDISFLLADPDLINIYFNTFESKGLNLDQEFDRLSHIINDDNYKDTLEKFIYKGDYCDYLRPCIIRFIRLLSKVSLRINRNEYNLINVHRWLVFLIKNLLNKLEICNKGLPPLRITPPSPPNPPNPNNDFNDFYKPERHITTHGSVLPKCESFDFKCFTGEEILKYKIRYNGKSDVCPNCVYGIKFIHRHWYDDQGEHFDMEYCGTAICNSPINLIYPVGIRVTLSDLNVRRLLIDVYTGRSLVYPDYYFITRFIRLGFYEIIPIFDPHREITQRVQYIYNVINYGKNHEAELSFTVTERELEVIKKHIFNFDGFRIYHNSEIAVKIFKNGENYNIVIVKAYKFHVLSDDE